MSNKIIYCERCRGEIKNKYDLVVASYLFNMVAYHDSCYSQVLKSGETILVGNKPINGTSANIGTVLAVAAIIVLLFIPTMRIFSLVFLLGILFRVYSWYKFERHLN